METKSEKKYDAETTAKAVWELCKRHLSPLAQARVRRRVVNEGWTLQKAITNEGLMYCRTSQDLSITKKLFEDDVLTVDEKPSKAVENVVDKLNKKDTFIPRPKPQVQTCADCAGKGYFTQLLQGEVHKFPCGKCNPKNVQNLAGMSTASNGMW